MSTTMNRLQGRKGIAPLTGVLAVILWVIGIAVLDSGDTPDDDAPGQVLAQYFAENDGSILAGSFIFMVGTGVFVWFVGVIRQRIDLAEGGVGRLAPIFFGAGILTAALAMSFVAPSAAASFAAGELNRDLSPGAAEALSILGDGFFIAAEVAVAVFFIAAGVAALRTRAFPAWLGWFSILLGIAALIPWIGWAAFIWGLPLWVLIVSIWAFTRPATPDRTEVRPATAV